MPDDNKIQTPDYDPENPRCDQEKLKFLRECIAEGPEGINKWNEWRKKDKDTEIWLQKANFWTASLEGASLQDSHLEGADLRKANLKRADLSESYLEGASLASAHLEGADLREANLKGVSLVDAKLKKVHLEGAYLFRAHLKGANLEGAHLERANLEDADLENANLRRAHMEGVDLLGTHLENAILGEAYLEGVDLEEAYLEGVDLSEAHLENANLKEAPLKETDLTNTHLEGAYLRRTHLEGAYFEYAHLERADLSEAHLEGASFQDSNLQGADFSGAIVNGETLLNEDCKVDRNTKFEAVGLDSMRIYPATKQLLEYNIRRMNWDDWYWGNEAHIFFKRFVTKRELILGACCVVGRLLLTSPVRLFWSISDYGLRTWRIIAWFFGLAVIFALAYRLWPNCVLVNGQVGDIRGFVHALYFSVVTMTTLGFGDIAANPDSWQGQVLLMVQVILGYVLLAALVTRFAVLFTAGGPAGEFAEKSPFKTNNQS